MKWQFQAEDHNRQDKAKKADYRGEMVERGRSDAPTISESLYPKIEAKKEEVKRFRRAKFFLGGKKFRFGWPLEHFSKINGLSIADPKTVDVFNSIKESAQHDMKLLEVAIMKGSATRKKVFGFAVWRVEFDVCAVNKSLKCDQIEP